MDELATRHALLVEMGFAANAAQYALQQTGGANMDDVLQFLQDHPEGPPPPPPPPPAPPELSTETKLADARLAVTRPSMQQIRARVMQDSRIASHKKQQELMKMLRQYRYVGPDAIVEEEAVSRAAVLEEESEKAMAAEQVCGDAGSTSASPRIKAAKRGALSVGVIQRVQQDGTYYVQFEDGTSMDGVPPEFVFDPADQDRNLGTVDVVATQAGLAGSKIQLAGEGGKKLGLVLCGKVSPGQVVRYVQPGFELAGARCVVRRATAGVEDGAAVWAEPILRRGGAPAGSLTRAGSKEGPQRWWQRSKKDGKSKALALEAAKMAKWREIEEELHAAVPEMLSSPVGSNGEAASQQSTVPSGRTAEPPPNTPPELIAELHAAQDGGDDEALAAVMEQINAATLASLGSVAATDDADAADARDART